MAETTAEAGVRAAGWRRRGATLGAIATSLALLCAGTLQAQQPARLDTPWPVVGRQGITRLVIVPLALARDREAYARQLAVLCPSAESCFVNFYTNSSGAELTVPLPDAVAQEATAVFRRSAKRGAEVMRWSCRLGIDEANCF